MVPLTLPVVPDERRHNIVNKRTTTVAHSSAVSSDKETIIGMDHFCAPLDHYGLEASPPERLHSV